jgi:hypothetical protein
MKSSQLQIAKKKYDVDIYVKPLIRLTDWQEEVLPEQLSRQLPSSTQPWEVAGPYKSWASVLP